MPQALYLGIDCGTQGTKALLVDENGTALGRGYASHALIERPSGAREQEPQWWVDALRTAAKAALATQPAGSTVRALGVSGQQHGLVVLDEALQVIRPAKLWNDTETAPQNAALMDRLGGKAACLERFGIIPLTGYTVSKLLWMAEKEPAHFARIRHILLPHDYLNFWLTGQLRAEYGDSSGTGFFDVRSRTWQRDVLDAIDGNTGQLFAALPRLTGPTEIIGSLRPPVAAELGLPVGCLVSSGGGDNMMGALGTGNVREGVVTLSLGTSSTVYSFSAKPPHDASGNVAPFCSSTGGWLPLVCTMNATNIVTGTAALFGKQVTEIDLALDTTPPGSDGLTFLPFLNGERTPDLPEARGALLGLSSTNFTPAHLLRAAVEGVTFGILNGLALVLAGKPVTSLRIIGGGAKSKAWQQLLSDSSGAEIHLLAEEESGCLGAALQAMVAASATAGTSLSFEAAADRCVRLRPDATTVPNPNTRSAYAQARARYDQQLRTLYGVEALNATVQK